MAQTLVLQVPEEVYEPLTRIAGQAGKTPETLAVEWLAAISTDAARDPFEPFIGAFRSDVPDWADRHDYYLGQALLKELRGEKDSGT